MCNSLGWDFRLMHECVSIINIFYIFISYCISTEYVYRIFVITLKILTHTLIRYNHIVALFGDITLDESTLREGLKGSMFYLEPGSDKFERWTNYDLENTNQVNYMKIY